MPTERDKIVVPMTLEERAEIRRLGRKTWLTVLGFFFLGVIAIVKCYLDPAIGGYYIGPTALFFVFFFQPYVLKPLKAWYKQSREHVKRLVGPIVTIWQGQGGRILYNAYRPTPFPRHLSFPDGLGLSAAIVIQVAPRGEGLGAIVRTADGARPIVVSCDFWEMEMRFFGHDNVYLRADAEMILRLAEADPQSFATLLDVYEERGVRTDFANAHREALCGLVQSVVLARSLALPENAPRGREVHKTALSMRVSLDIGLQEVGAALRKSPVGIGLLAQNLPLSSSDHSAVAGFRLLGEVLEDIDRVKILEDELERKAEAKR